ncbi:hypothetical protein QA612_22235 [Evansella sp. AB-P1]|uniref:hypothetical protein n=1 Tax=Evansella sp. AB-P1 TaxID=3037653 RepID=UPI00241C2069|nr:hypothetical protein [Evansella sp. AB-P1]MDG5790162.1 hypothetical protein [Evansella sp. AB-P1]
MKKLLLIAVCMFITACSNQADEASNLVTEQQPITNITIEDFKGPTVIEVMREEEMNRVIDLLQLDEWTYIDEWDYDLAPNFYISINDEILIGLFDSDRYAFIDNVGYYDIPKNIVLEIREMYDDL